LSTRDSRRIHPLRRIFDAIFFVARAGCAWRDLPCDYPPWRAVVSHFRRFRLQGKWRLLKTALYRAERKRVGRHPDPSATFPELGALRPLRDPTSADDEFDDEALADSAGRPQPLATLTNHNILVTMFLDGYRS
jgi:transposase